MRNGGGINLHALVRPAISAVHPDLSATLHRSVGQTTEADGGVRSVSAPGMAVRAQMQSGEAAGLCHEEGMGSEREERKVYLFSGREGRAKAAGIVRELARGGDMLQLEDGSWWLITAVLEDFSRSGWTCVRATRQIVQLKKEKI
jgi:hypothetical protein